MYCLAVRVSIETWLRGHRIVSGRCSSDWSKGLDVKWEQTIHPWVELTKWWMWWRCCGIEEVILLFVVVAHIQCNRSIVNKKYWSDLKQYNCEEQWRTSSMKRLDNEEAKRATKDEGVFGKGFDMIWTLWLAGHSVVWVDFWLLAMDALLSKDALLKSFVRGYNVWRTCLQKILLMGLKILWWVKIIFFWCCKNNGSDRFLSKELS